MVKKKYKLQRVYTIDGKRLSEKTSNRILVVDGKNNGVERDR